MSERAATVAEHLRRHLTDGAWHDRCEFCLNRRRYGGTGVPPTETEAARNAGGTR